MDSMAELGGIVPVLIMVAIVLGYTPASAQSAQSRTALAFAANPKAAADSQATLDVVDSESGAVKTPPTPIDEPTQDASKEC
ncbi:hypothetical protein ONZ45_g17743 [Pleurotus djamor]|nr:hypothetical protein ONZ45_g17743 [Pleurotus djamor]